MLNRIITLRDDKPAQVAAAAPAEKKQNVKAATRPKTKSPAEYRAEARSRDENLARIFKWAIDLGLPENQVDLLTGETGTAALFEETVKKAGHHDLVAKWIINSPDHDLDPDRFAEFIGLVADQRIPNAAAKNVFAEMVKTGKRASELAASAGQTITAEELGSRVQAVIDANAEKAAQYKAGKTGLPGFFVGQVMKSAPNADAAEVNRVVRERLG